MKQLLVYAIGNTSRADDGIGPAVAEALAFAETTIVYQPSVEDSELISHYKQVLFIDADIEARSDFEIKKVLPNGEAPVFTHGLSLDGLLSLCQELYHHTPEAHVLAIKAKNFELGAPMRPMPCLNAIKNELAKILTNVF